MHKNPQNSDKTKVLDWNVTTHVMCHLHQGSYVTTGFGRFAINNIRRFHGIPTFIFWHLGLVCPGELSNCAAIYAESLRNFDSIFEDPKDLQLEFPVMYFPAQNHRPALLPDGCRAYKNPIRTNPESPFFVD